MAEVKKEVKEQSVFEKLYSLSFQDIVKQNPQGANYVPWADAWAAVCKIFPKANYKCYKNADGLPYAFDHNTGYMVFVTVTLTGDWNDAKEMWLPVTNNANKAMKSEKYTYMVKGYNGADAKEKTVESATMFNINTTLMRCLVKVLAMFGSGLYVYTKDDYPKIEDTPEFKKVQTDFTESENLIKACKSIKELQEVFTSLDSVQMHAVNNLKNDMKVKLTPKAK